VETLEYGDSVVVTADWLGVPLGAHGVVVGSGLHNPVTCFVHFGTDVVPLPAIHLRRAHTPGWRDHAGGTVVPLRRRSVRGSRGRGERART
jgi:hypothetical protein